jgi:hypothetical protein
MMLILISFSRVKDLHPMRVPVCHISNCKKTTLRVGDLHIQCLRYAIWRAIPSFRIGALSSMSMAAEILGRVFLPCLRCCRAYACEALYGFFGTPWRMRFCRSSFRGMSLLVSFDDIVPRSPFVNLYKSVSKCLADEANLAVLGSFANVYETKQYTLRILIA